MGLCASGEPCISRDTGEQLGRMGDPAPDTDGSIESLERCRFFSGTSSGSQDGGLLVAIDACM